MIARLVREPVLVIGVVTALFGVLAVFGVELTERQIGAIVVFLGAVMSLVRFLVTPNVDVAATVKPGRHLAEAGPGSVHPTGTPVVVLPAPTPTTPLSPPPPPDVTGGAGNVRL